MDFNQYISPAIAFLGVAWASWLTYKTKSEDRQVAVDTSRDQTTSEQSKIFQANLLARVTELESEVKALKKEKEDLRDRMDIIKGGLFTMSLMGSDAPFAMWSKDSSGNRIYHNEAYEAMTGFSLSQCVGLTDYQIIYKFSRGTEEVRRRIAKEVSNDWEKQDEHVMSTGNSLMTIEQCCHANRPEEIFMVLVTKWASKVNDRIVGVQGKAIKYDVIQKAIRDANIGENKDG